MSLTYVPDLTHPAPQNADAANPVTVTIAAGVASIGSLLASESFIGKVGGQGGWVSQNFTRPNDTTAYAAKDVVGPAVTALIQFDNAARVAGGSGYITAATIETTLITWVGRFRLWLYSSSSGLTAIADNSPFLLLYGNRAARIGSIDFDATATEDPTNSTSARSQKTGVNLYYESDVNNRIWGMLETLDAGTPAAQQQYYAKLRTDWN